MKPKKKEETTAEFVARINKRDKLSGNKRMSAQKRRRH